MRQLSERAVVFDLDGTLVDSAPAIADALQAMRRQRGIQRPLELQKVRRWVSGGALALVQAALEEAAGSPDEDVAEFRRIYADIVTSPQSVYAGVLETLEALVASGIRLGICTNKPQRLSEHVLRDVTMERFFGVVLGGDAVPRPKPHADHLLATLRLLRTDPSEAVYVGDSSIDLHTAAAANVRFVLAAYGYADEALSNAEVPAPVARIGRIADLPALLAGWHK